MTLAISALKFNAVELITLNNQRVDLTNSIMSADYFEDILSPCVTMIMNVVTTNGLYNGLPIRGGEKVVMDVTTATGEFVLDGDYGLYVYKVGEYGSDGIKESFNLYLVSREGLTNETSRVEIPFDKKPINEHVKKILDEVLLTNKYVDSNIERTSNSYSFIGNNKKPFHVLTWLGPKGIPSSGGSGADGQRAKGVAGFLFYETKDGFNFKSIDTLVSATKSGNADSSLITFTFNNAIEHNNIQTEYNILDYSLEKNVDLMKALRVGTYANKTYFYDLYENKVKILEYFLKNEIRSKLGQQDDLVIPLGFDQSYSRILVRTADRGVLDPNSVSADSGRDVADMAKSFSRYNILFTQSLNMAVPCNVNLRAGGVINAQFPKIEASTNTSSVDLEQSGKYLIKELRHHFEGNNMVTSLKLVRDSYGLY